MPHPNILYIHSHDTGRYIQPYGFAIATPRLQQFAEQGVVFRQAFCAAPTCSPSRAALLTGQSAHSAGMLGLVNRGFELRDFSQHLVSTLKEAGYTTALVGIQHVAKDVASIGYDRVLQPGRSGPNDIAPAAVELLGQLGRQQPFFLDVGFFETHREFLAPGPEDDPRWLRPPLPLPDTPATRGDMAAYQASARALDEAMGRVFDALAANGLAENTLVICTTDHGLAFPGMKCNLTDHGIGVMLLLRGPSGFSGGRVVDALVSQIDLFPTLCDLLGLDRPAWLQGVSLLPLIRGEADEVRDELFAEVTYHASYEPQRAVRTRRWKYTRRYGERLLPVMPNCDDSPSKDVWLAHDWRERPHPREALYDLVFDPNEAHNLADDPEQEPVLDDLRARLDRWMRATGDPLLHGDVPAPEGVLASDPDDPSPRTLWEKRARPQGYA